MIGVRFLLIFSLFFCSFRLYTEENQKQKIVWRFDFTANGAAAKFAKEWSLEKKFMTKPATFFVKKEKGKSFLEMEADCATASIVCNPKGFKVVDAPIIRWCWKVTCLPNGADGRFPEKDDQAIGIYVGSGSYFSKKSISYRWDTETPVGDKGNCAYGAGTIKVKWFTLRNKNDKLNEWIIEERNWLDDYKEAWGEVPDSIYLSISCNSQYTATKALASLMWIEFLSK